MIGAVLAFTAVRKQISQTERLAEDAKLRKQDGITAVSTIFLDEMVDYADKCIIELANLRSMTLNGGTTFNFKIPDFPQEAINSLRDYIEYGSKNNSKKVSLLIYATQIQNSRLTFFVNINKNTNYEYLDVSLQEAMFDAIDVRSQADGLFPHVRAGYYDRDYDCNGMTNGLLINNIQIDDFPYLKSKIERLLLKKPS